MNLPAVVHPRAAHGAADPRHAGIGVRQQHHRRRQGVDRAAGDRHRLGLHQPGEPHAAHPGGDDLHDAEGVTHNYGGIMGILGAAGVVFFAYIGFDAVSTAAQEAKNPERDMPIGILGSLVVCTILYVLFSYVLSGVATVEDFRSTGREASVAFAISKYMTGYEWLSKCGDGGDPRRLLVGHPGHAARAVARVLLDEQGRPGAAGLLRRASEVPDAVQVERRLLRVHGALRRVHPRRHRRRDDEHRDAVRVHAGLRRRVDHAQPAARTFRAASRCRRCRWSRSSASSSAAR